jgi:hypothetical protein
MATTTEERRRAKRADVQDFAFISSGGASTRCVIINISAHGAAISVPNSSHVPSRFQLMTENDRVIRGGVLRWIIENTVGVEFEK